MPPTTTAPGRQSLVVGNFSNEMMALYSNEGTGLFIDDAPASAVGKASLLTLTFACFFFDADLDGLLDIFAANGHVADDISHGAAEGHVRAAAAPLPQSRAKKFDERSRAASARRCEQAVVARGAAYGDIDNDGDLDLVITANNGAGPAPAQRRSRRRPQRAHPPRRARRRTASAIGARVRVQTDDGRKASSDGEDRIELPVAERAAADLRPGPDGQASRRSK